MKKHIFSIWFLFLFTAALFSQPDITSRLTDEIEQSIINDSFIKTIIVFEDQLDVLTLDEELYRIEAAPAERSKRVIKSLQEKANNTQGEVLKYLYSLSEDEVKTIKSFWIINMISLEAKANVLLHLSSNDRISKMDIDNKLILETANKEEGLAPESLGSAEPGLKVINAHRLWELGYTGAGRIVMNIDTGVDVLHPAFGWRWRGNHVPDSLAWFDPVFGSTFPNDGDGHGTATMGIACGLDSVTHDTIGVAFGVEWIASNSLWGNPHTSYTIAAFQWAMDPDGNPASTDDMPDVINNSWWDPAVSYGDTTYTNVFNAVEAAGIALIFSAGAGGPSSQSILTPANINTNEVNTWATGAIDGHTAGYPIKLSSGRGPSQCYTGISSLDIKPEGCAPGVNIRTSVINNSYHVYSGNSMATAHVTGAVALLKEAYPYLTGHEIKMALYNTALDLGIEGEDNVYGMGLIDVYAAYQYLGPSSLNELTDRIPAKYALHQNYPNPFNPTTTIKYDLLGTSQVKLSIYNILGEKIRTLVNRNKSAGYKSVVWDGLNDYGEQVSTGVYIYRIETENFIKSRKMVFMK